MRKPLRHATPLSSLLCAGALSFGCAADGASMSGGGKADGLDDRDRDRDSVCELVASPIADAAVDDLDSVLDVATTLDFPAMTIDTFQLSGCDDILGSPEGRDQLGQEIANLAYDQSATDFPEALVFSDLQPGGEEFADRIGDATRVIEERIEDGLWDPADDPAAAEIWNRIGEVTEAIVAPIDDVGFAEQRVQFENAECSEDAVGLYSDYDETLVVIHELPRC